jgi:hypothetical protein
MDLLSAVCESIQVIIRQIPACADVLVCCRVSAPERVTARIDRCLSYESDETVNAQFVMEGLSRVVKKVSVDVLVRCFRGVGGSNIAQE